MEFNFKSYDNSRQSISYCEVDKCKAVIKLKKCIKDIKNEAESLKLINFGWDELNIKEEVYEYAENILNKISECEGNDE